VTALSATNAWAVGDYCTSSGATRTFIAHFNGSAWRTVRSPNVGAGDNALGGVDAVSPTNVWAVGNRASTSPALPRNLAEHWNGTSWKVVQTPNVGTGPNYLTAVAALSRTNVWAVGWWSTRAGAGHALALHWNGASWKVVPTPSGPYALYGVSGVAANDVWATGIRTVRNRALTLAMHWDGSRWRVVTTPSGTGANYFDGGVKAITSDDVWAVGRTWSGTASRPLALHWNGSTWSIVATPHRTDSLFAGVDATSRSDVWAVGSSNAGTRTFVEHWNGVSWRILSSPSPGLHSNELTGVSAVSPTRAFAVGFRTRSSGPGLNTLVLRWAGAAWRVM
jgi:hypothetical protein